MRSLLVLLFCCLPFTIFAQEEFPHVPVIHTHISKTDTAVLVEADCEDSSCGYKTCDRENVYENQDQKLHEEKKYAEDVPSKVLDVEVHSRYENNGWEVITGNCSSGEERYDFVSYEKKTDVSRVLVSKKSNGLIQITISRKVGDITIEKNINFYKEVNEYFSIPEKSGRGYSLKEFKSTLTEKERMSLDEWSKELKKLYLTMPADKETLEKVDVVVRYEDDSMIDYMIFEKNGQITFSDRALRYGRGENAETEERAENNSIPNGTWTSVSSGEGKDKVTQHFTGLSHKSNLSDGNNYYVGVAITEKADKSYIAKISFYLNGSSDIVWKVEVDESGKLITNSWDEKQTKKAGTFQEVFKNLSDTNQETMKEALQQSVYLMLGCPSEARTQLMKLKPLGKN